MIHFRVHDPNALRVLNDPTRGRRWDLRSSYLIGPDAKPMRGSIEERDGHMYCESAQDAPVGIAILVDTKSAGRLVLQTCFLPSRDEPYDLFLEIARWLIKQFVEECETWQMWSPTLSGDAFAKWDAARDEFARGASTVAQVRAAALRLLSQHPELTLDYLDVADPLTLEALPDDATVNEALLTIAVSVDGVRLLDERLLGERSAS